jgi:hypothetical protein
MPSLPHPENPVQYPQYAPPYGQYPAPPAQPAPYAPMVPLTIVTKQPMFSALVSPRAEIDGYPVPLSWGANVVGLTPGVHHIAIHMPWLWKFGRAQVTVDNRTVPPPTVYYAMPWVNFGDGAIGFGPVKNPQLGVFLTMMLLPVAVIAVCVGAAILSGNG